MAYSTTILLQILTVYLRVRVLKIGEQLAKLPAKCLSSVLYIARIMQNAPDNLCMTDRNS